MASLHSDVTQHGSDGEQPVDRIRLLSKGSMHHASGECQPCAWFWKPQGCLNGWACLRCHLCAPDEVKKRKKAQLKQIKMSRTGKALPLDGDFDELPTSAHSSAMVTPATSVPSSTAATPRMLPAVMLGPSVPPPSPPALASLSWDMVPPPPAWSAEDEATPLASQQPAKIALALLKTPDINTKEQNNVDHKIQWVVPPGLGLHKLLPPVPQPEVSPALPTLMALRRAVTSQDDQPPALQEELPSPSLGSALHSTGTCTPCAWFWKPQGCHNGLKCGRCHLCPQGEVRLRKKAKLAAMQAKAAESAGLQITVDGALILD
eukprot:TRINITY_DN2522_c0_g1_i1.p1 TRINITY_DN2522_c0_g1~~TRINITY_DN2522_c0_g1_i1.p1  ORF type:complete len:319 (-),score=59.93 TRINITY_DN2522_c0_g1_i1:263-1219(-)